jgi:hypothetical protein
MLKFVLLGFVLIGFIAAIYATMKILDKRRLNSKAIDLDLTFFFKDPNTIDKR